MRFITTLVRPGMPALLLMASCQKQSSPHSDTAAPQPVHLIEATTSVPFSALVEGRGLQARVFLVRDGKARSADVTVKAVTPSEAVLQTALPAGSLVVATGAELLTDGANVDVRPTPAK